MSAPASASAPARSPLATQGLGMAYAIGAIISMQFGSALAKTMMGDLGAWGVVTLRLITSSLLLYVFFRPQVRQWTRPQWIAVAVLGVALFGANAFFYVAIQRVPLAIAVAIEFMGPLVLATVLSRRKLDLVWVALSFTGMAVLTADSQANPEDFALAGVFFAVLTAISRAAYILATEKVGASIPGMGGMVMGNIVSTLLVLPFPFFITGNHLEKAITDPALLGLGFVMGLLASALPALGEVSALRMLPSNVYSVVLSLEPAFAAIVGIFMLAENTGLIRWAAIALLISASIGITLSHARAERSALAAGKRESIEPYLPGAVDNIGAGIAQMTGAIELPTPEQVAADKARRQDTAGKTHSRTGEEG